MSRLVPAVAGSLVAHVGLAVLLLHLRPGVTTAAALPVVEVAAVSQPRLDERTEEREPILPPPLPPPRQPAERATPHPRRTTPPRVSEQSEHRTLGAESEHTPPTPQTEPIPGPQPSQMDEGVAAAVAASGGVGGTAQGAPAQGARPGSGSSLSRRRARENEGCSRAVSAVARGLRSLAYPSWLRELGFQGRMRVLMRVGLDGRPRGVRIERTSGHAALDRHVLQAIRRLGELPRCRRPITVPVHFELPAGR